MIFNYDKLKGKIKEKYKTQENFAKAMEMGRVSLSKRLNNEIDFTPKEMVKACLELDICVSDIPSYFFCIKSSETRTKQIEEIA